MVSIELKEPAAPMEEALERHQTEAASWSYYVPCAGVKYYAYQEWANPINDASPREASLLEDRAG